MEVVLANARYGRQIRHVAFAACFALLFLASGSRAQTLEAQVTRLWQTYHGMSADSAVRAVEVLSALSHNYRLLRMPQASDSVADMAFKQARQSGNEDLLMRAMNDWFLSLNLFDGVPQPFRDTQRVAGYVRTMFSLARQKGDNDRLSQAWNARAAFELSKGNTAAASDAANKSFYHASLSENKRQQTAALLTVGTCEKNQNDKLEAFGHYMDALSIARALDEPGVLAQVYERLFYFYYSVNNYEKAEEYLYKIFPLVTPKAETDSEQFIYHSINLALLQCAQHDYDAGLTTARSVLDYCGRVHNRYFRDDLMIVLKSVLIEDGQYRRLSDLYRKFYPAEWQRVVTQEPAVYYQLMAAFSEADGQYDSSQHYYGLAKAALDSAGWSAGSKAFFYRRYGQAMLRFGKKEQALPLIDTALRYSEQIQYLPYMAELSNILDSVYAGGHKMDEAYHYSKLNQRYTAALTHANRQDEILMMDMENELRGRELLARQEEARTQRRHNIQYMAIVLLIGFCFMILTLLGSFRVRRWVITAMGFFSFIFFFEFIILLIDHWLHDFTHGEPWKILSIKIIIIAILLPLHHWMEHRVVHYLQTHRIIDPAGFSIRKLMQKMRLYASPGKTGAQTRVHDPEA